MRDFGREAKVALRVYHERGLAALACLEREDHEAAQALLAQRVAAFHNFRAVDALAQAQGYDVSRDEELTGLRDAMMRTDAALEEAIRTAMGRTKEDLARLSESRRTLSKYRGLAREAGNFERSV